MKNFFTASVAALAGLSHALPTSLNTRQSSAVSDITILQFALTLEHLENVFYKEALLRFQVSDFEAVGLDVEYLKKLIFVVADEQSHVGLLSKAITAAGSKPVGACQYNFPYTDVQSFLTLSSVLEGVGTSAYLGAAALVSDKTILTTAGSILVAEALHTSQQRDALKLVPAANPLGTPLGANAVFTLAASFITSCPASNEALPFKAFPTLTGGSASPAIEGTSLSFTGPSAISAGSFLTFVSGLTITSVSATISDTSITASVPTGLGGQTYVMVTSKDVSGGTINDADVLMGPAIIEVTPGEPGVDINIVRRPDAGVDVGVQQ